MSGAPSDPALLNAVSRVFFEEVREWLRAAAGVAAPGVTLEAGAVTDVQRLGGSLNLNPHLHVLVADGVFACREDGTSPTFVAIAAPTRDDLRGVIARVIERLDTIARRRAKRGGDADGAGSDDAMEGLRRAAGGRGTFARVDEKGARDDGGEADERALAPRLVASRGLVAEMGGFNQHAGVRVEADRRRRGGSAASFNRALAKRLTPRSGLAPVRGGASPNRYLFCKLGHLDTMKAMGRKDQTLDGP